MQHNYLHTLRIATMIAKLINKKETKLFIYTMR